MKSMIKNIVTLTIGLFVGGTLINLYGLLFKVPDELLLILEIDADTDTLAKVKDVLYKHIYFTGVEFAIAVGLITFLFLNKNNAEQGEVVYVEKYINEESNAQKADSSVVEVQIAERRAMLQEEVSHLLQTSTLPINEAIRQVLTLICNELNASAAIIYGADYSREVYRLHWVASYAYYIPDSEAKVYEFGEGLAGQVARSEVKMYLDKVPSDALQIKSGLGKSSPSKLLFLPLHYQGKLAGVLELGTFKSFSDEEQAFIQEIITSSASYLSQYMESFTPSKG